MHCTEDVCIIRATYVRQPPQTPSLLEGLEDGSRTKKPIIQLSIISSAFTQPCVFTVSRTDCVSCSLVSGLLSGYQLTEQLGAYKQRSSAVSL